MTQLTTKRLVLRPWKEEDRALFRALNADPRVMEFFPSTLSAQESDAFFDSIAKEIQKQGWGLWAVGVPSVADCIGFIGLNIPSFSAHFTPAVEIGWRLAYDHWGKGYATEGARCALQYGFDVVGLQEIVSFTAAPNIRSQAVMKKIGMTHDAKDDFDHPKLPEGHPLRRHVLYRIKRVYH